MILKRTTGTRVGLLLLVAACSVPAQPVTLECADHVVGGGLVSYPTGTLDGNRHLLSVADLPATQPLRIPISGSPRWVTGATLASGTLWLVLDDRGRLQAVFQDGTAHQAPVPVPVPVSCRGRRGAGPPLIAVADRRVVILDPGPRAAEHAVPVVTETGTGSVLVFVRNDGTVAARSLDGTDSATLELADGPPALPDARIVTDGSGRVAYLSQPTTAYPHGIVGDRIEASSVTVWYIAAGETATYPVASGDVIEGIGPIWADVDGDGHRELIVTTSNGIDGARLMALREDGSAIVGPPVGLGFRWRNQAAVAPFGSAGDQIFLADVLTPHIGGTAELFAVDGDRFVRVGSGHGYSSHRIRSRNLDQAIVADLDADGTAELFLPDDAQRVLAALRWDGEQLEQVWSLQVGGRIETNIATVADGDRLAIAVATRDTLVVWPAGR